MFLYIYLSVERFERFFNLLPLSVGPSGQHVDDGLFVRTESFHGGSEHSGVGVGVEILCRAYRGSALEKGRQKRSPVDVCYSYMIQRLQSVVFPLAYLVAYLWGIYLSIYHPSIHKKYIYLIGYIPFELFFLTKSIFQLWYYKCTCLK